MCLVIFAACGDDGINHLADAPTIKLLVEPPDAMVTIVNGQPVTQAYTATLISPDGKKQDVTAQTTFQIDPSYGQFSSDTVKVSGQGAGPTKVYAIASDVSGEATLFVFVKQAIIDPSAPPNAEALFEAATEDAARAPAIAYPLDHILVPPNLGQFDVHWRNTTAANNLFQVTMANQYVDVRLYTTGLDVQDPRPFWTLFQPLVWYPIASSRQQLDLKVTGLDTTAPATKGTSAAQKVDVTNENAQGGIYYWTTSSPAGIWRYDVAKPTQPPEAYFPDNARPAGCMGCHALSRDGTKIAMTLDGAFGRGAIFNVADRMPTNDFVNAPVSWDFAAFDSKATKLVTVENGQMNLRDLAGTALIPAMLPNLAGPYATHPELSPDDSHLVNVEFTGGADYAASGGTIVTRTYNASNDTFGAPSVLVPLAGGAANYYPSYSPDGQWIVFTRTSDASYNSSDAQTWVVKADGTLPPVALTTANLGGGLTNSWARWVPFAQTFGAANEPMFYLTFSTQREFGVRIPQGENHPQIWMTPFFPARAAAGQDPSGPAFRVPFQQVDTANHIAQWTQAVVVQ